MNFNTFLQSVSKIKHLPLPAEASHFKMVPPFRQKLLINQSEEKKTAKQAGVLALFYPDKNQNTNFVLILRKAYNGVHSAQVSFPGGKLETQDKSLQDTALRETFEEVGVPTNHVTIVKTLSKVYIPPSNFNVQPFLGFARKTLIFKAEKTEVETIVEVPLKHLLNDNQLIKKTVSASYSPSIEVPAFKLSGHVVWGATAMMLSEIKDMLKQVR